MSAATTAPAPATILVVFGTRPEAIKLFPVVAALKADPRFRPVVCVSAQHREMLDQVLEIAGIVPDHDLDVMQPDQSLDALTASAAHRAGQGDGPKSARPRDRPGRYGDGDGRGARRLLPQGAGRPCRGGAAQRQHLSPLARGD
jgi:hypothetical protein